MTNLSNNSPRKVLILSVAIILLVTLGGISVPAFARGLNQPASQVEITPTPVAHVTATTVVNPHLSGECMDCHGDPRLVGKTIDGDTVSLYVQPGTHEGTFHNRTGGGCTKVCHESQTVYPHETSTMESCASCHWQTTGAPSGEPNLVFNLPYADVRAIAIEVNSTCKKCHTEIFESTTDSAHTRIMQEGNRYAPLCSDCHGAHDIQLVDRAGISAICKKCHLAEYSTYKGSVHGSALEVDSNPDVPTCANCHGSHLVSGPSSTNFREQTVKICGDCHANKSIMDKYGISTNVLSTYMDDVHGLTDWFRKTNLENITRATCYDCHGKHNILKPDDPASQVYPENLQITCQQCHKDANIRFPQTWLSHKKVDLQENAGLTLVNTLSWIIVILAALAVLFFIALDVRRRFILQRQAKKQAALDSALQVEKEAAVPAEKSYEEKTENNQVEDKEKYA
jgi:hypothetical protein